MCRLVFVASLWLGIVATAWGEPFTIDLSVQAGTESKTVHAEVAALGVTPKKREVLHAPAKSPLSVRWVLTNADTAKSFKNVVVHFFAVQEEKLGQINAPKLNKGVAAESALTVDLGPKGSTRGEVTFTIDMPGFYLVRVETIGVAAGAEGQEYFAALDVVIE
jgi:hypothetical protein